MSRRAPDPEPGFRAGQAALVGRANVGKSTLLNRLVGDKIAIVSPVVQTTRHRILGVVTRPEGQVALVDSPGFHKPRTRLGAVMIERAREVCESADAILWLIDAAAGVGPGDRFVREQLRALGRSKPIIAVLNKIDLMNKGKVLPLIEEATAAWGCAEAVPISAATGENCERLLEVVFDHLPRGEPLYPADFLTDQSERQLVAEVIREKLLGHLRQEIPHAVAVRVEAIERRADGLVAIGAVIVVERPSHKKIVIGHKGRTIRAVGTAARRELEERMSARVYLDLFVKVQQHWRDRPALLRELGLYG